MIKGIPWNPLYLFLFFNKGFKMSLTPDQEYINTIRKYTTTFETTSYSGVTTDEQLKKVRLISVLSYSDVIWVNPETLDKSSDLVIIMHCPIRWCGKIKNQWSRDNYLVSGHIAAQAPTFIGCLKLIEAELVKRTGIEINKATFKNGLRNDDPWLGKLTVEVYDDDKVIKGY